MIIQADYLFMVEQAAKAPSGHNTQPWKFRLNGNSIEIHPDITKALPVVDPENRELFVSLGCAAENLCIAASHRGYRTKVSVGKDGVITITLAKQASVTPSPLLSQIPLRQTNRRLYTGQPVPDDTMQLLEAVPTEPGVAVHVFAKDSATFDDIAHLVYEGNRRQLRDERFVHELQSWMRYNKKHQDETRDGLSYAVFGAPNIPRRIAQWIISRAVNETSQNKLDEKKIAASSHMILLTTRHNTLNEWVRLGMTLERLLLTATELGIAHAYMNQPNEVAELAKQLAARLAIPDEHPTVLLRIGYGKPMPYSLRRDVNSLLISMDHPE